MDNCRPSWLGIMPLLPTADAHTWLFGCVPHAICSDGILPVHKLAKPVPRAIALDGYIANTASGSYFVQSLSFGHHFNALLYPVDIPVCCSDLKQKKIMCSSSLLLLKLFFLNLKRGKQSRCNLSLNYFYYFSYEKYLFLLSW